MIASVTALLAGHLASGGLFVTSALALAARLPVGFLRFCAGAATMMAGIAAAVDPGPARIVWLALAGTSVLWYFALRRPLGRYRLVTVGVLLTSALSSGLAPWLAADDVHAWTTVAGGASSSLLLGAVAVTMILGHWYLVDTSLSIAPLKKGAAWVWVAVASRWAAVGAVLLYGGWEVLQLRRAADLVWSTTGLFFLFRSLMGLAAPLLLAGLIWQTVKIRSTQSATGLLYVALVLVLFGELVSQFLFLATGYPL